MKKTHQSLISSPIFVVDITGTINDKGQLVMEEHFNWSDGEISSRTWTLELQGPHHITGTAGDVIGKAEGEVYGNVLNWRYQVNLEVKKRTWKISFDDWMYKVSDTLLLENADTPSGQTLLQLNQLQGPAHEEIP